MTPRGLMLVGLGMAALGGIITGVTYAAASEGGVYIVAGGLVFVGGVNFVRGLYYWLRGLYAQARERREWATYTPPATTGPRTDGPRTDWQKDTYAGGLGEVRYVSQGAVLRNQPGASQEAARLASGTRVVVGRWWSDFAHVLAEHGETGWLRRTDLAEVPPPPAPSP